MKKTIVLGVLSLGLLFSGGLLVSCGNSNSTTNNQTTQSNEITLTAVEQEVFNSIKISLSAFKNPSSVTVVKVSTENVIGGRYVWISAQNSLGGYTTSVYQANPSGLSGPKDISSDYSSDPEVSISRINLKLKEYKESVGW